MAITITLYYKGKNKSAIKFVEEVKSSGLLSKIRNEPGNLKYEYYLSFDDKEVVLLLDKWKDQRALDLHHSSSMMEEIIKLKDKYNLTTSFERFIEDKDIPLKDKAYIK